VERHPLEQRDDISEGVGGVYDGGKHHLDPRGVEEANVYGLVQLFAQALHLRQSCVMEGETLACLARQPKKLGPEAVVTVSLRDEALGL
jgi:hypothetical protein